MEHEIGLETFDVSLFRFLCRDAKPVCIELEAAFNTSRSDQAPRHCVHKYAVTRKRLGERLGQVELRRFGGIVIRVDSVWEFSRSE